MVDTAKPDDAGTAAAAEFQDAFAQFSETANAPITPPPADAAPPAAPAGSGDADAIAAAAAAAGGGLAPPAPAGETPPVDPAAAGEPAKETPPAAAVAPPAAQPPAAAPVESAEDIVARLAEALKPQAPPAPAVETPPAEAPLYTAEEQEILAKYDADWPDVARAETLRRRGEYTDLLKYFHSELAKVVAPLNATVDTLASRQHISDLSAKAPDFETLRDGVFAWVDEQPDYLQIAYKHVIQNGTADQVADLINRFKASGGSQPAVTPPPAPAPAPTPKKVELSDATKQAVAGLAPVDTQRTVVPQQDDPNDFSAAFDKFATAQT